MAYKLPFNTEILVDLQYADVISESNISLINFQNFIHPTKIQIKGSKAPHELYLVINGQCILKFIKPAPILDSILLWQVDKKQRDDYLRLLDTNLADALLFEIIDGLCAEIIELSIPGILVLLSYLGLFVHQEITSYSQASVEDFISENSLCINCLKQVKKPAGLFCNSRCFNTFTKDSKIYKKIIQFRKKLFNQTLDIYIDEILDLKSEFIKHFSRAEIVASSNELMNPSIYSNTLQKIDYKLIKRLALEGVITTNRNKFLDINHCGKSEEFDEVKGNAVHINDEEGFFTSIKDFSKGNNERQLFHIFNYEAHMSKILKDQENNTKKNCLVES